MANNTGLFIGVAVVVGAIGVYWRIKQDKTPIGLVVVKSDGEETLGQDSDGAKYTVQFVEGTYRKDKDSLGVASIDDEQPLLVIFKDGEPIEARLVTKSEWMPTEHQGGECDEGDTECEDKEMDAMNAAIDNIVGVGKEYGVDMDWLEGRKVSKVESSAESIFGPTLSLQSHFVW